MLCPSKVLQQITSPSWPNFELPLGLNFCWEVPKWSASSTWSKIGFFRSLRPKPYRSALVKAIFPEPLPEANFWVLHPIWSFGYLTHCQVQLCNILRSIERNLLGYLKCSTFKPTKYLLVAEALSYQCIKSKVKGLLIHLQPKTCPNCQPQGTSLLYIKDLLVTTKNHRFSSETHQSTHSWTLPASVFAKPEQNKGHKCFHCINICHPNRCASTTFQVNWSKRLWIKSRVLTASPSTATWLSSTTH